MYKHERTDEWQEIIIGCTQQIFVAVRFNAQK